ncbi:MAG: DUF86 domain-containing protein [Acidobacteriota bacterium]|nr:DUF86 domain-containing protein [Acidobacteriota bacterium]
MAILGEAADPVSDPLRDSHPEVPWRRIVNQRNILVHVYGEVDVDLLCNGQMGGAAGGRSRLGDPTRDHDFDQVAASARPKDTINARFSCTR